MDGRKKITPLSQRGIAAYMSGLNTPGFAQTKDSNNQIQPTQQDTPEITPGPGVLGGGADVGRGAYSPHEERINTRPRR